MSPQQRSLDRAARVIRFIPGITRLELAQALGVTVSTVHPVVAALLDSGRIEEQDAPRTTGTRGRPRAGLRTTGRPDVLGVVLWSHGTLDISLARFDRSVLWRRRTPVGAMPTLDALVEAADALVRAARTMVRALRPRPRPTRPLRAGRGRGRGARRAADPTRRSSARAADVSSTPTGSTTTPPGCGRSAPASR